MIGGSATADAVDVNLVAGVPPLSISAVGGTADVVAPPTNGTNASGAATPTVADPLVASSTASVVDAVATRGATSLSASSDVNNSAVALFGDSVASAGNIASNVVCPLVGTPTASASATVTIGAQPPVTLSSSGTGSATDTAVVTDAMFVGGTATVTVTATTDAAVTTSSANATGLRMTFAFASGTLAAGLVDLTGTSLGSEVLAETSCTSPTGPDAAPSSALTIAPNSGPDTGGTATTITGSGFTGATGVSFDGVAGTSFSVVDDTIITVTTPPGAVGPADVVVIGSGGGGTLPAGFTYIAAAPSSALAIAPNSGPSAGGTATTITGSGFTGATGVSFDGVAGTSFSVVDDTTITVTTPPGVVGPADVVVIDSGGDGALPAGFTYTAAGAGASAPTEISPASGPAAGSTPVTIRGAGFMRAAGVTFDGAAGTSFAVVDDTTITVTTPSGAVGPADVVVIDAAGNGALPRGFTYVSAGAMPRTGAAIMMMLAAGTSTMGAGLAIRHFARRRRPLHAAT